MQQNLSKDRIDLWCAFPADIHDEALLLAYQSLLSETEQKQYHCFYSAKDRQRYLVTRVLVRITLSRYASISPEQWVFATNAHGKPYITNCAALNKAISFNITHADNLIILAVTHALALGVDTENSKSRKIPLDIAESYLASGEVADLRALSIELQQQRFFEYWTLKEAYIKARGIGLSIALNQFSFHFPYKHRIELIIKAEQNDVPARWRFWQCRLENDYLMAVCVERAELEPPLLSFKHVVPLVMERALEYELLRTFL